MKRFFIFAAIVSLFTAGASLAHAHAFLDHADPKVGSTLGSSPSEVKIWFTDELTGKVSKIEVLDAQGKEVDKGDVKIDSTYKTIMTVSVSKLPAGSYKVVWNAVCPYGHHTSGTYTFEVKSL